MDKILTAFATILDKFDKLTLKRVVAFGLLMVFGVLSYTLYLNSSKIGERFLAPMDKRTLIKMSEASELAANTFMKKYRLSASYMTILRFDYPKNTRVPIYRVFNDADVRDVVMGRLNGGDGALPMFIKDDETNNNQLITIIQGDLTCDPFNAGGLARVWPDLVTKFTISCRVPIPPSFGGARGYVVVHFKGQPMRPYEFEAMKIDLMALAVAIHSNDR